MPRAWLPVALLCLVPAAAAGGGWTDARGDGDPDLLAIAWDDDVAGNVSLTATLAAAPPSDAAARWIWARGTAGQPEPDEWYIGYSGNATAILVGHGSAGAEATGQGVWGTTGLSVSFTRVQASSGACTVMAVEVGHAAAAGLEVTDRSLDGGAALEDVWPATGPCPDASLDALQSQVAKGSPAPTALVAALAVLVAAWRRR